MTWKTAARFTLLVLVILGSARRLDAASATLSWNANTEPNLAGYIIYYGTQSGVYTNSVAVGIVTSHQVTNLATGTYYFAIQAYDTSNFRSALSTQVSATVTGSANQSPVVTNPGNLTNAVGSTISLQITAVDPNGDPITYSATGLPSGLNLNSATGRITGTVTQGGVFNPTVFASDGQASGSQSFTWTVTTSANRAPVVTNPGNRTSAEGAAATLQVVATDPDGNPLTYGATGLPAGLSINTVTGFISGTLPYNAAGSYIVGVSASDGQLTASQNFVWTVTNTNRAPSVTNPGTQTTPKGTQVLLQIVASDPDGDPLVYTVTGLPPGLTIAASTGRISGLVSSSASGSYSVRVTVSDGTITASQTFTWTIGSANGAPSVTSPGSQTGAHGDTVSLQIVATDPDNNALTYSATGLPPGLTIDANTGLVSGTVSSSANTNTPYTVVVSVTDGKATASATFSWTVTVAFNSSQQDPPRLVDLNRDGRRDIFLFGQQSGNWYTAFSSLRDFVYRSGHWSPGWQIFPADLNGDGIVDLFLFDATTGMWFQAIHHGDGTFTYHRGNWSPGWPVRVGDFNGDRKTDIFLYDPRNGQWYVCFANGAGGFSYKGGAWSPGWHAYVADFNGDGRADVFVYDPKAGTWFVCQSDAAQVFLYTRGDWSLGWKMYTASFDGNAFGDLFLFNDRTGQWFKALGQGNGRFTYETGAWSPGWTVGVTDLNGDRRDDVFLLNRTSGQWFRSISQTGGFSYRSGHWSPGWSFATGDLDGDGRADVFLYDENTGLWFRCLSTSDNNFSYQPGSWSPGWTLVGLSPGNQ